MFYHLLTVDQFENQFDGKQYGHELLERNAFLHCCTGSQMEKVLEKHYAEEAEVIAFEINEDKLISRYSFESPGANDEPYPHIHGIINSEAISDIFRIKRDQAGAFILP